MSEFEDRQRARSRRSRTTRQTGTVRRRRAPSPQPIRQQDDSVTNTTNSVDAQLKTVSIESLLSENLNISVMRNGWPNWGLRNRDMKILEGFSPNESNSINMIFSMIMPYVSLSLLKNETSDAGIDQESPSSSEETLDEETLDDPQALDNFLFSNDELMKSISVPIPSDEAGFLSFAKNRISIKSVSIDIEETTGLYSVKNFKFSFVIHRIAEFMSDPLLKAIFDPSKKFLFKYGYNFDVANTDILPVASRILSILGPENKDTIMFNSWDLKQEDNDQNVELEAQAIPAPSKCFVTVKMGENNVGEESESAIQDYQRSLEVNERIRAGSENTSRGQQRTRDVIQGKINSIIIEAFDKSMSTITKNNSKILFEDILNEISECVNHGFKKNNINATFKFACGKFNESVINQPGSDDQYIGSFEIDGASFKKFYANIKKSKNIPHALEFLDSVIGEYLGDYTDFRTLSGKLGTILDKKEAQEKILTNKSAADRNKLNEVSEALKKIDEELQEIMLPVIKFFTHEHREDNGKITYYCFVIDTSFGLPNISKDTSKSAFEKILEVNKGSGVLIEETSITESDLSFLNGDDLTVSSDSGVNSFDIPIINLFAENSIFKSNSLSTNVDEELQASLLKQQVDKDARSDERAEGIGYNDMFKFLTTQMSFKMIGNNAIQIYQPLFWRFLEGSNIFSRLYNVTKLTHDISNGDWSVSGEALMCAI